MPSVRMGCEDPENIWALRMVTGCWVEGGSAGEVRGLKWRGTEI
jgi:hypothetical protein